MGVCNPVTVSLQLTTPPSATCRLRVPKIFLSTELIWKVARSTSAAPIFFTEFEGFVDGGVKANNPCEHALTRIQEYLDDQRRKVGCMVSVGCGQYPPTDIGDTDVMRVGNPLELFNVPSFFKRAKDLLTLLVSSVSTIYVTVSLPLSFIHAHWDRSDCSLPHNMYYQSVKAQRHRFR